MSPQTASDPTYSAAVERLRRLFAGSPKPDRRSIQEIYVANGRNLGEIEKNKHWLRDNMADIRRHGLADTIRSSVDDKTVEGVRLTDAGKRALSAPAIVPSDPRADANQAKPPLLDRIARDVRLARAQYPNLEIELSITVRKKAGTVSEMTAHPAG